MLNVECDTIITNSLFLILKCVGGNRVTEEGNYTEVPFISKDTFNGTFDKDLMHELTDSSCKSRVYCFVTNEIVIGMTV
jgi:hypothetical protein